MRLRHRHHPPQNPSSRRTATAVSTSSIANLTEWAKSLRSRSPEVRMGESAAPAARRAAESRSSAAGPGGLAEATALRLATSAHSTSSGRPPRHRAQEGSGPHRARLVTVRARLSGRMYRQMIRCIDRNTLFFSGPWPMAGEPAQRPRTPPGRAGRVSRNHGTRRFFCARAPASTPRR